MSLDTDTEVQEIQFVEDSRGNSVPAASDAEGLAQNTDIDITGSGVTLQPYIPDGATSLLILVESDDAAKVTVNFNDPQGDTIASRGKDQNSAYSATGGTDQIAAEAAIFSPYVSIEIEDTSGNANTADYTVRVV